ncbi:unnamed protein product [Dimorphilus gyrociliatus]|uniref:Prohibitin n=1 Tax=Dimorphilus gyrociliatus TaxID=2664684 RepID=A0A7I8VGW7_9ANNE|nr:unnamed protein product [Dimorphilus gyrociliatus]
MSKRNVIIVCIFALAIALTIIILVRYSLSEIESHEVGLKYDNVQKSLEKDVYYEGLHMGSPGFTFIKYSAVFRTMQLVRFECLNKDEVKVNLELSFQYRVRVSALYEVTRLFKDEEGHDQMLESVAQSAVHEACSNFNTSQFQTERGSFQTAVKDILLKRLGEVFTDIADLQMQNIQRPRSYEIVVQNKETAREDIDVARQERPRLMALAKNKLEEAKNEAEITLQKATSNARVILTAAEAEAKGIETQYESEAAVYKTLKNTLRFSNEDFIKYLATRAIFSEKDSSIDLAIGQPPELNLN